MSELYIPPERPERNLVNGRFLKGHTPHNKGKKWADYMDMRKAKRIKRIGVKNLVRNYRISGWNAKPVVAIKDDELVGIYPSASEAGRKAGICGRNIISCCSGKRKHAGGYQWFWEWAKFRNEFQRLLPNVPIIDLHDALLSAIENRLVIDIIALDKRLRNMYPEEWEFMSMKEIIIKHYGLKAMQLIESVL